MKIICDYFSTISLAFKNEDISKDRPEGLNKIKAIHKQKTEELFNEEKLKKSNEEYFKKYYELLEKQLEYERKRRETIESKSHSVLSLTAITASLFVASISMFSKIITWNMSLKLLVGLGFFLPIFNIIISGIWVQTSEV